MSAAARRITKPKRKTVQHRAQRQRARKISITVDAHVLSEVQKVTRATGASLSAHVTEALAKDLRQRRLAALVESFELESGRISDQELEAVRRQWRD